MFIMISEEIEIYKKDRIKMQKRLLKYIKPDRLDAKILRQAEILLATTASLPEKVSWEVIKVNDSIPCEWISTPECTQEKLIYYIHGGSCYAGSASQSRETLGYYVNELNINGLSIDYRLAPEDPFPLGLEDCVEVYKWLVETKHIHPKNIIVFGSSAGGGLALATLIKLKELGIQLPAAAVLLSPWLDLSLSGDSVKDKAEFDGVLNELFIKVASKWYCGENDLLNPLISPLFADLNALPPLFLQVGSHDILVDDSIRLSKRAKKAGVEVLLEVWDEMPHSFMGLDVTIPEVREARSHIIDFVRNSLSLK